MWEPFQNKLSAKLKILKNISTVSINSVVTLRDSGQTACHILTRLSHDLKQANKYKRNQSSRDVTEISGNALFARLLGHRRPPLFRRK